MKNYYYFCACSGALTADTPWFKIPFGSSARDKELLAEFSRLSLSTDYYFAKVSAQSDEFRLKVAVSLCDDVLLPLLALPCAVVNPAAVLNALRSGVSLSTLCGSARPSMRLALDPQFRTKIRDRYGIKRIS